MMLSFYHIFHFHFHFHFYPFFLSLSLYPYIYEKTTPILSRRLNRKKKIKNKKTQISSTIRYTQQTLRKGSTDRRVPEADVTVAAFAPETEDQERPHAPPTTPLIELQHAHSSICAVIADPRAIRLIHSIPHRGDDRE